MLTAVCSVNFHLIEGQTVDAIYPEDALDDRELSLVSLSSFPDSMSFEIATTRSSVRDTSFSFVIPRTRYPASSLHGHVFCRQRFDESMPRGGDQRAIVVLSEYPLQDTLSSLALHYGPLCLGCTSSQALATTFIHHDLWSTSSIKWGSSFEIALAARSIRINLPEASTLPNSVLTATAENRPTGPEIVLDYLLHNLDEQTGIPACYVHSTPPNQLASGVFSSPAVDLFSPLSCILQHTWTLWEIMMLGDPLMVVSPSPAMSSSTVYSLLSLVGPFPYNNQYRPFFSVHDPCFPMLARGSVPLRTGTLDPIDGNSNATQQTAPTLIGITNPHLLKAFSRWPNVVSTGYTASTGTTITGNGIIPSIGNHSSKEEVSSASRRSLSGSIGVVRSVSMSITSTAIASKWSGIFQRYRHPKGPESLLSVPADTAWLSHRPHTCPDQQLLSDLAQYRPGDSGARRIRIAHANTNVLRKHFDELTRAFLYPLLECIHRHSPRGGGDDGGGNYVNGHLSKEEDRCLLYRNVDIDDILQDLSDRPNEDFPKIVLERFYSRKSLIEFYSLFLRSNTFIQWWKVRCCIADIWQSIVWRENQCGGFHEQQLQQYFDVQDQLKLCQTLNTSHQYALLEELKRMHGELPDASRNVLVSMDTRRF